MTNSNNKSPDIKISFGIDVPNLVMGYMQWDGLNLVMVHTDREMYIHTQALMSSIC